MLSILRFDTLATAVAPIPSPVIVTIGCVVYPEPASVTRISVTPVNELGISSNRTVLLAPILSKTSNSEDYNPSVIVPRCNSVLKLTV
jgi:hypothetical protein